MTTEPPATLWGVLHPGEKTTRMFSRELPEGYIAVLERVPHSGVRIADQTSTDITLENQGDSLAPYMVIFLTEKAVRAVGGALDVFRYVLDRGGK